MAFIVLTLINVLNVSNNYSSDEYNIVLASWEVRDQWDFTTQRHSNGMLGTLLSHL